MPKLRFAMICASNVNRSMAAHAELQRHGGLHVRSFGVGNHVKLPGRTATEPNVYEFGTPYEDILADLRSKDSAFYARVGLVAMLERDARVKRAPERWQAARAPGDVFDVVLCFEERVMEQLVEDMAGRVQTAMRPLLVVNIDVKDSHEEAARVAPQALALCRALEACEGGWEAGVDACLADFERKFKRRAFYTVCFY
jgi:RNA polymerase II subunit A C-terminal domain phosphatase SSU72